MRNQLRMLAAVLSAMMVLLLLPAAALAAGPDTSWYSPIGGASAADPYLLHDADDLAGLADLVNAGNSFSGKYIKIASDANMDLSAYPNWTPIGITGGLFSGTFDGNHVPISNLHIEETVTFSGATPIRRVLGLFGQSDGRIQNVVLNEPQLNATYSAPPALYANKYAYAGAIAGVNNGIITGCAVTDATLQVSGITVAVGGIAGYNGLDKSGSISNCSADAQITASAIIPYLYAGGVAGGEANNSTITGCESEGSVTITAPDAGSKGNVCRGYAGGIVGYMNTATVENSQSESEISVSNGFNYVYAGGLAGHVYHSSVKTCSSSGDVYGEGGEFGFLYEDAMVGGLVGDFTYQSLMQDCYSTGDATVVSKAPQGMALVGGLAGAVDLYSINSTITRCFAMGNANAEQNFMGEALAGGLCGRLWGINISDSFAGGDAKAVSGSYAYAGGFAGYFSSGTTLRTYATGDATAQAVNAQYAGGYVGRCDDGSFTKAYSTGSIYYSTSSINPPQAGAFIGNSYGSTTLSACYFDSLSAKGLSAIGVETWGVTGTATGVGRGKMTSGDVLSTDMSALNDGGEWNKRTNTATEWYYPELNLYASAGGDIAGYSKTSVTASPLYQLTVTNGTGSGEYFAEAVVDISANAAPGGQEFDKWVSGGGGTFGNAASAETTFTMPYTAITITATYKDLPLPERDNDDKSPALRVVETPDAISDMGSVTFSPVGKPFSRPVDVRLTQTDATEQEVENALQSAGLADDAMPLFPLEISMFFGGTDTPAQPRDNSFVRILMPVPQELLADKDILKVVQVSGDMLQVLKSSLQRKNGVWMIQFDISRASTYALVADGQGVLVPGTMLPLATVVNPPKTGDAALCLWILPFAAGLGLIGVRKRCR